MLHPYFEDTVEFNLQFNLQISLLHSDTNACVCRELSIMPRGGGGGVLRYISDGDVQSPFLGLKFAM